MYMKIIFLNRFTPTHIIDYNMIVSLLVCNWSAAMLSSAIYLKVERWKKLLFLTMTLTIIMINGVHWTRRKKNTLDPQSYQLRSSSPGAPCWQAWGGFIGNVKTLSLTLTLALSCTWLLKSSGMLLVTPKAIQKIYTKNLKFRDICNKTCFFTSFHSP